MKISPRFVAAVGALGLLAACSNGVEPVDQAAAQMNPDGDIEIYDVKSHQVLWTTDQRLVDQSDRKDFIAELRAQGKDASYTWDGDNDSILKGVVVNARGYTNSLYCDFNIKQCDVGEGMDSSRSYHLNDNQVPTKAIDPKGFDIF